MSQQNIEALVRRGHDAFNRGDLDAFIEVWDEECEYQPAMERDMAGDEDSFRGHDGIRRWWQEMSDAWSAWDTEVHEVRAVGDQVFISLYTWRNGKLVEVRSWLSHAEALEAAGLRE